MAIGSYGQGYKDLLEIADRSRGKMVERVAHYSKCLDVYRNVLTMPGVGYLASRSLVHIFYWALNRQRAHRRT